METIQINEIKNKVTEVNVTYANKIPAKLRMKISNSRDAAEILTALYDEGVMDYIEQFHVLLMNKANQVLGHKCVAIGSQTGSVVPLQVILQIAIKGNASAIIIAHNHPSGNMQPSEADIKVTRKIKEAAATMDIALLDHVILCSEKHYSFADEGMM